MKEVLDFKDNNPSRYGLSLILGTKELSVENIAKLYTGLGNYGNFKDLKYTRDGQEEKGDQLISRGSAYLTLDTIRQLERPGLESMYREKILFHGKLEQAMDEEMDGQLGLHQTGQ